jgi:hypothetical protein
MAITIVSHQIANIQDALPNVPNLAGGRARFTCARMHCEGAVRFNGLATNDRVGWHIGWIQAQWIETNTGYYRGQADRHGSILIQRGRPPARTTQACRDTSGPVNDIFTDRTDPREFQVLLLADDFPCTVRVESNEDPSENYPLILTNTRTHQPNFLQEVQLEFHFCTVLTVEEPGPRFHHLAAFYWNVHWQFRFWPRVFPAPNETQWHRPVPVTGGVGAHHSRVIEGTPTDGRFVSLLTTDQALSCVGLADQEKADARNRQDFTKW